MLLLRSPFLCAVDVFLRDLPRISVRGRCVQVEKSAAWNILMLNRCYLVFWAAPVGPGTPEWLLLRLCRNSPPALTRPFPRIDVFFPECSVGRDDLIPPL